MSLQGHALYVFTPIDINCSNAVFTEEFWSDPRRQAMWAAFCKKSVRTKPFPSLEEVVALLATFIVPPALAAGRGETFDQNWQPGEPWLSPQ
jgi:hypothetical protein